MEFAGWSMAGQDRASGQPLILLPIALAKARAQLGGRASLTSLGGADRLVWVLAFARTIGGLGMSARDTPPPALSDAPLDPGLYVVSTPIGNLRDITLRALDVLANADLVLAEDTRTAARLLTAYGLKKPIQRYDDHAGAAARPGVLADLAAGGTVALTSDAGAPLVSRRPRTTTRPARGF